MGASRPLAPAALSAADWEVVFQKTLWFATYQVKRLRWRGDTDGILPDGYDPNSIAAQAIMEFLQQQDPDSLHFCQRCPESMYIPSQENGGLPSQENGGRLSLSPRERAGVRGSLASAASTTQPVDSFGLEPVLYEINRLVLKHVTRLYHRKENFILASTEDLAPVWNMDGELVSALEFIPGPDIQPDEALIRKESNIQFFQLKKRFEAALPDRPLRNLLELRCHGISKPQVLAARLKLPVRTIYNLSDRLQRAWVRFANGRSKGNGRASSAKYLHKYPIDNQLLTNNRASQCRNFISQLPTY